MSGAEPRKNENGDSAIRPIFNGINPGTRPTFALFTLESTSVLASARLKPEWFVRPNFLRNAWPAAIFSLMLVILG